MNSRGNEMLAAKLRRVREGTHPIGRAKNPQVVDLMTNPYPVVPAHISMDAARKIARLKSADALVVEDKGNLVGWLDACSLREAGGGQRVDVCVKSLRLCLTPTTTVSEARALFVKSGASSLPIAAGPFLIGSVSRAAVERFVSSAPTPRPGAQGARAAAAAA